MTMAESTAEFPNFVVDGVPAKLFNTVIKSLARIHGYRRYDKTLASEILSKLNDVEALYLQMVATEEEPSDRRLHSPSDPIVLAHFMEAPRLDKNVRPWPKPINGVFEVEQPDIRIFHDASQPIAGRPLPAGVDIWLIQTSTDEWVYQLMTRDGQGGEEIVLAKESGPYFPNVTEAAVTALDKAFDWFGHLRESGSLDRQAAKGVERMMTWIMDERERRMKPAENTESEDDE